MLGDTSRTCRHQGNHLIRAVRKPHGLPKIADTTSKLRMMNPLNSSNQPFDMTLADSRAADAGRAAKVLVASRSVLLSRHLCGDVEPHCTYFKDSTTARPLLRP
jgi:hypothetical protein